MKVNLKEFSKEKAALEYLQSIMADNVVTKPLGSKLKKAIRLYEEIEKDLEIGGESIIELDKPRLEAIEERNKTLMRKGDMDG